MAGISPEARAFRLRKDLALTERDFDLDELVRSMGFEVRYETIASGAEGLGVRFGGEDIIRINSDGRSERRQRFTLAHELGHFLLGHCSICEPQHVHGFSTSPEERAANEFAAALLMPAVHFREDARHAHPRMDELSELADLYGVSRSAAALRFVRYTEDGCAVVGVTAGSYWCKKSPRAEGWWLPSQAPAGSLVQEHVRGSRAQPAAEVDSAVWLENYRRRTPCQIREEVAPAGPGAWLVLLSELPDPEEDPDVEDREADEDLERRRRSFRRY